LDHQDGIRRPVVLVVDDDEAVRAIAESDLDDAGYEPITADSLCAALAIASRREIDVVLLDIVLPRGVGEPTQPRAGIEAIPELRAACPAAEIVMLSAHDKAADQAEGRAVGASDYLLKPFGPIELIKAIKNVLDLK